jgi:hypothetical protein
MIKLFCSIIFFQTIIFPQQSKLSKAVNYLSGYVASNSFLELDQSSPHLNLVDSIYIKAIKFYDEDYSEALLALTFATVPYRKVPITLPLINVIVYYPLISADLDTYLLKNKNLPSQLFYDSPQNNYGDKDKLAHFFGNSFIGYAEPVFDLADVFGYFVEAFEEDFKAQSKVDFRDMNVNWYGKLFGDLLEENKKVLPSQVMLIRSFRYFNLNL